MKEKILKNSMILPSNYESLIIFSLLWTFSVIFIPGVFIAVISGAIAKEYQILSLLGSFFVAFSAWIGGLNLIINLNRRKNKAERIEYKCRKISLYLVFIFAIFVIFEIVYSIVIYT